MKGNSCNICAAPPLISSQSSHVHNGTQPKSVRCVMRRNPPASTRKTLLIEDATKKIWFNTNRYIILQLANALKCPPVDVMNYLYKLSFCNFGKALNLKNAGNKSCHVPLANANYEMYFGIFDSHGNLRNPLRTNCLKQLLQIMRIIFTKLPNADKADRGASTGVFKAMGVNLRGQRDKNDCFGACVSNGELQKNSNCKLQNFYHIDGRYAGLDPEVLVGYPADAIGQNVQRLACEFADSVTLSAQQAQAKTASCSELFKSGMGGDRFNGQHLRKEEAYRRGIFGKEVDVNDENLQKYVHDMFGVNISEDNDGDNKILKRVGFVEGKGNNDENWLHGDESFGSHVDSSRKFGSQDANYKRFGSHDETFNQFSAQDDNFEQFGQLGDRYKLFDSQFDKSRQFGAYNSGSRKRYSLGENAFIGYRREGNENADVSRTELVNVLRNVNLTDRIADNVSEIIEAVKHLDTDMPTTRRNTQFEVIHELSEHYSGIAGIRKPKRYLGEPIPLLYHEPFDPIKPWTYMRRHPKQLRATDRGKISNSQIRRYRRESFDEKYKKAKRRYSIQSTFSDTDSRTSQAMFGDMYAPVKSFHKMRLKTKSAIINMHHSHHMRQKNKTKKSVN